MSPGGVPEASNIRSSAEPALAIDDSSIRESGRIRNPEEFVRGGALEGADRERGLRTDPPPEPRARRGPLVLDDRHARAVPHDRLKARVRSLYAAVCSERGRRREQPAEDEVPHALPSNARDDRQARPRPHRCDRPPTSFVALAAETHRLAGGRDACPHDVGHVEFVRHDQPDEVASHDRGDLLKEVEAGPKAGRAEIGNVPRVDIEQDPITVGGGPDPQVALGRFEDGLDSRLGGWGPGTSPIRPRPCSRSSASSCR